MVDLKSHFRNWMCSVLTYFYYFFEIDRYMFSRIRSQLWSLGWTRRRQRRRRLWWLRRWKRLQQWELQSGGRQLQRTRWFLWRRRLGRPERQLLWRRYKILKEVKSFPEVIVDLKSHFRNWMWSVLTYFYYFFEIDPYIFSRIRSQLWALGWTRRRQRRRRLWWLRRWKRLQQWELQSWERQLQRTRWCLWRRRLGWPERQLLWRRYEILKEVEWIETCEINSDSVARYVVQKVIVRASPNIALTTHMNCKVMCIVWTIRCAGQNNACNSSKALRSKKFELNQWIYEYQMLQCWLHFWKWLFLVYYD